MDTSTGLIYVGNGQYYDPTTGRFLSRGVNSNSTNPYVPWGGNPTGALFTPLALLSLIYSRRRKHGKLDTIILLIVLGVGLSMSLAACAGTTTTTIGNATVTITPIPSQNGTQSATVTVTVPPPTGSPVGTPSITCTATVTQTATPTPVLTLSQSELLDIYTEAGIKTQSPYGDTNTRFNVYAFSWIKGKDPYYTGIGPAKVTDAQMEHTRGDLINGGHNGVGLGLRTERCGFTCPPGQLDQDTDNGAYTAMHTRISLRTDVCLNRGCTPTDEFLVAALGENEESMNPRDVQTAINQYKQVSPPVIINWQKWLVSGAGKQRDQDYDLKLIKIFKGDTGERSDLGVDWEYVHNLIKNP